AGGRLLEVVDEAVRHVEPECIRLPSPRAELRDPREHAQAEPERREEPVEEDERGAERRVPDAPAPQRNGWLGLHEALALASAARCSTSRMMRCEISSIESSLTSSTGHPSRRWTCAA